MSKKLYTILTALFATFLSVNAQSITDIPKQVWWNYYDDNGSWYIYGSNKAERYQVATFVPYGYLEDDITIDGLSLFILDSDVSDIQYWVSTTLPNFDGQADLETVELPMSDLKFSQFNEVKFKESHMIPQGGLYIGYSFSISDLKKKYSSHPISFRESETLYTQGFFYCTSSNTSWTTYNGDLTIRILSSGQFKNNAVNVFKDNHIYTIQGSERTIDVKLQNAGTTPVKSVRYAIETDGKQVASGTCEVSIQDMMSMSSISIPIPTDVDATLYNRTIAITEVNSQINESNKNQIDIKQYNLLAKPQFVPLFEEFTGTWCGWCVRGIVAMNKAHEQYGDKAAIIAIHDDNAMRTDDYKPIVDAFCNIFPSGIANRKESTGIGSTNAVVDLIKSTIEDVTLADLEAKAYWANAEQTEIRIDTKTTFQLNMSGNYAIAYILTEDGLTGTGSAWAQSNFYSGKTDSDPDMQYWCSQPSYVTGVVFNHVAVAAWQPRYGINGSVENIIKAGVPQTYSYTVDIRNNTIIQDKSKLKMITLLLNAETGDYINAAQTTINAYNPSAIDEAQISTPRIIERYRIDGQKINTPQHGINIIRMNDGTIKKVIVK